MSTTKKGYIFTDQHRKNLSLVMVGEGNHRYGTEQSIETKEKRSKAMFGEKHFANKKVSQYTLDNILIQTFYSQIEAQRKTKIQQSNIVQVCKGTRKSAGGFIWRYN